MDLVASNPSETLGVDNGVECLFPSEGSNIVLGRSAWGSQCILSVFFPFARL